MNKQRPKLFNIPFSRPFAQSLAKGVLARYGDSPESLSKVLILLPTRRACRALAEMFLEVTGGKPMLLPRIQPLGDIDEEEAFFTGSGDAGLLEVPSAALRRQMMLAALIQRFSAKSNLMQRLPKKSEKLNTHFDESVWLAGELLRLIDEMRRENIPWDALETLVPQDYSEHWQLTINFLNILREHWPQIERDEGIRSAVDARSVRIEGLARAWQENPPQTPIIAAGSTGSIPSTALLLGVISKLPQGQVVLQGVDRHIKDEDWKELSDTHPQYGFMQLLGRIQASRNDVEEWPGLGGEDVRDRLLSTWMVPAAHTADWHEKASTLKPESFENLHLFEAQSAQEETALIAGLLRETLETEGKTAALVTHDRDLARRVASFMQRFGVQLDDSAGRPLLQTTAGTFVQLLLDICSGNCNPVSMLSFFKHPLFRMGHGAAACRQWARQLELKLLRGQFYTGWQAVAERALQDPELKEWMAMFMRELAPCIEQYQKGGEQDILTLWRHCTKTAEALSLSDAGETLWEAEGGEALWQLSLNLEEALLGGAPQDISSFAPLIKQMLILTPVRPRYGRHPRLHILSPLEARLLHFDRVILGGLNEDSWPEAAKADPWLSRPMRASVGLPTPERRIGQSAHDFCQMFACEEIFITRAQKQQGVQTVPSRWMIRFKTMLAAGGLKPPVYELQQHYKHWLKHLDTPFLAVNITPPAPCPPLSARPRKLSVSRVQELVGNPYKVYASQILKLKALKDIFLEPDAQQMGTIIHKVLDEFACAYPETLPEDMVGELRNIARKHMEPVLRNSASRIFWHNRFDDIAVWLSEQERSHRQPGDHVYPEAKGAWTFDAPAGPFTLTAEADRLDVHADGTVTITDYKTGTAPKEKDIESGEQSQLVLEALILANGSFGELKGKKTRSLQYWQLKGRGNSEAILLEDRGKNPKPVPERMAAAKEGLERLIARFDDARKPYHSITYIKHESRKEETDHLARIKEWSA